MAVWFTADTHFGHAGALALYRRPFASVAEMDAAMQARWNDVVQPDDDVWHLGDFALRTSAPAAAALLRALNGRKHLITGNNDPPEIAALPRMVQRASLRRDHRRFIPPGAVPLRLPHLERHGQRCAELHGHSHGRLKPLPRQTDVGVDAWDFRPVPVQLMRGADSAQSQGAPRRSGRRLADQVVVDPLGDQPARPR